MAKMSDLDTHVHFRPLLSPSFMYTLNMFVVSSKLACPSYVPNKYMYTTQYDPCTEVSDALRMFRVLLNLDTGGFVIATYT